MAPRPPFTATQTALQNATTVSAAAALAVCTVAISVAGGMMAVAAGLALAPQQRVFRIAALEPGPTERDTQRLADMQQVRAAVELYYDSFLGFPPSALSYLDSEIGRDLICLDFTGWRAGGCWGQVFLDPAPRDPSSEPLNDPCAPWEPWPCDYSYARKYAKSFPESSYEVHFRLEAASGDLPAGLNCATESGVGPTCSHTGELYRSRATGRDDLRLQHIEQVRTALQLYHGDKAAYPVSPVSLNYSEIGRDLNCLDNTGWRASGCGGKIFLNPAPREPLSESLDDPCSPSQPMPCDYAYQSVSGKANQYNIHFRLELASGELPAGLICATEQGLASASCPHPTCTATGPDLCDGIDNDCKPTTTDGSGDPAVGSACDGADADLCKEGTATCTAGVLVCNDANDVDRDRCNGINNATTEDCNVATPDGAGDPAVGSACDGADADRCAEGVRSCSGGVLRCSDTTADNPELCNQRDDDCDGLTDEQCLVTFRRGDANADGKVDIADPQFINSYLFLGGRRPPCLDAADANDSGAVDISDFKFVNDFLFLGGKTPPSPGPYQKGPDPTADTVTCLSYP